MLSPLAWLFATAIQAPPLIAVRAAEEAAPCVEAAARAAASRFRVRVDTGRLRAAPGLDVLVGSEVEMTRALESGVAVDGSEVDIARIPWVLVVPAGNPRGLTGLADLAAQRIEVWTPSFPAAYEARRAAAAALPGLVREAATPAERAPAVALLPLSLAAGRESLATAVPPIVVRAAVAVNAPHAAAAADFVRHLASAEGQRTFSRCQ